MSDQSAASVILLLDDMHPGRAAIAERLAREGYRLLCSAEVPDPLPQTELILCHTRRLNCPDHWQQLVNHAPVIVLTEKRDQEQALIALSAGVSDYLQDPEGSLDLLASLVRRTIEHARLERERASYQHKLEQTNFELQASLKTLQQDQEAGRLVQRQLMPAHPWTLNDLCFDYWSQPMLYLSGDFVDYWSPYPDVVWFYLADVAGHGASSAFVTILLKHLLNRYSLDKEITPACMLGRVNQELITAGLDKHLTIVLCRLNPLTRTLTYSVGAHLPAPIMVVNGQAKSLIGAGMPVGLFPDAHHEDYTCAFPEHAQLCLASDGVLEMIPGDGLDVRQATWLDWVARCDGRIDQLADRLQSAARKWPDDVTLMMLNGC